MALDASVSGPLAVAMGQLRRTGRWQLFWEMAASGLELELTGSVQVKQLLTG